MRAFSATWFLCFWNMPTSTPSAGLMWSKANWNAARVVAGVAQLRLAAMSLKASACDGCGHPISLNDDANKGER